MKLVLVPILSFVIVISVAFLLMRSRLAFGIRDHSLVGLPPPLLAFSVLNTIVLAVLLGSHELGAYDTGGCTLEWSDDEEDREGNGDWYKGQSSNDNGAGDDDEDASTHESDRDVDSEGYDEDDDESGSEDEIGWGDEEEQEGDHDLERRIEDFIDKVVKGWREERMKEHLTEV